MRVLNYVKFVFTVFFLGSFAVMGLTSCSNDESEVIENENPFYSTLIFEVVLDDIIHPRFVKD